MGTPARRSTTAPLEPTVVLHMPLAPQLVQVPSVVLAILVTVAMVPLVLVRLFSFLSLLLCSQLILSFVAINYCTIGGNSCDPTRSTCIYTGPGTYICSLDPDNLCDPGYFYEKDTNACTPCVAGTFSLGAQCIPCQKGSSSNVPASPSPSNCQPCTVGQYSFALGSTSCSVCSKCNTIGSITASPSSPFPVPYNSTIFDQNGNPVRNAPEGVVAWIYVGLFVGFVVISGVVAIVYGKRLRRLISAAANILRTPATILRVVISSESLVEEPSFFRGLVGIWVAAGVILVTIYQIHIFISQGRALLTAVQPGTVFTSGSSTSSASTTLSLSLALFQTPITCDSTAFTLTFSALNSESAGSLSGPPTSCVVDVTLPSLNLTYNFAAPLSFTSTSSVVFTASSINQSPLFSHGASYNLTLSSYQGETLKMWQTLTNDPTNQLTGDVTVDLSAIPTEYLYDTTTQSTGYTYTHFSSSADSLNVTTSSILSVTFNFPVSQYFYQIKNVQAISDVVFLTGLLSLGAGVIAGGSLFANAVSYVHQRWVIYSTGRGTSSAVNKEHLVPLI